MILQEVPSPLTTGNAFDDHSDGSRPHGAKRPASSALLISFSYIVCKGVLKGLVQNVGSINPSFIFRLTWGTHSGPGGGNLEKMKLQKMQKVTYIHV